MPVSATVMTASRGLAEAADGDVAAGRSVLDGVVEEILQHVAQESGIATNGGELRRAR